VVVLKIHHQKVDALCVIMCALTRGSFEARFAEGLEEVSMLVHTATGESVRRCKQLNRVKRTAVFVSYDRGEITDYFYPSCKSCTVVHTKLPCFLLKFTTINHSIFLLICLVGSCTCAASEGSHPTSFLDAACPREAYVAFLALFLGVNLDSSVRSGRSTNW